MHSASQHFKIELRHCKLMLFVIEWILMRCVLALIFILELLIDLKLLCSEVPSQENEEDREDAPPEADSKTPNHALHLILELIHDSG